MNTLLAIVRRTAVATLVALVGIGALTAGSASAAVATSTSISTVTQNTSYALGAVGYGQVFIRGYAPPIAKTSNGKVTVFVMNTSTLAMNSSTVPLRTDNADRSTFTHTTKNLPTTWCGKKIRVWAYAYNTSGTLLSFQVKEHTLFCGPQITLSTGTGRFFTPGGRATVTFTSGSVVRSVTVTVDASGNIRFSRPAPFDTWCTTFTAQGKDASSGKTTLPETASCIL